MINLREFSPFTVNSPLSLRKFEAADLGDDGEEPSTYQWEQNERGRGTYPSKNIGLEPTRGGGSLYLAFLYHVFKTD